MSDYVIIGIMFFTVLISVMITYSKIKKYEPTVAYEIIESNSKLRSFLINYQCQVKCFAIYLDYYHKTGEWLLDFIERRLTYYINGNYIGLIFEGEYYTIGIIPTDFPIELFLEKTSENR